jgi:hypothetical protein
MLVEVLGHLRHLGLGQAGDPERLHQLVHPSGGHSEQVAGCHHAGQRRLGAAAASQEPVRKERALPQLGHRHVQRADPGVQVAVPVAVAPVGPVRVSGAVLGAAHAVGLCRQQRVDERLEHLAHQIGAGLRQLLVQELLGVDTGCSGHRGVLLRVGCERSLEGSQRWPRLRQQDTLTTSYTTMPDSTASGVPRVWRPVHQGAARLPEHHSG